LIKGLILLPVLLCLPALIMYFTYWHMISTNNLLTTIGTGADATKIELFWNKFEPLLNDIKEPPDTNYIYINNISDVDDKYIKEMVADRITISRKMADNPPKISLIFSQPGFLEILKKKTSNDSIYAFQFDGKEVIDIKEKLLNTK